MSDADLYRFFSRISADAMVLVLHEQALAGYEVDLLAEHLTFPNLFWVVLRRAEMVTEAPTGGALRQGYYHRGAPHGGYLDEVAQSEQGAADQKLRNDIPVPGRDPADRPTP